MSNVKKGAKNFKKLPLWAKITVIAVVVVLIATFVYVEVRHPEIIDALLYGRQDPDVWIDGELKVHFINIGQGDAIYIQFPDGKDMLIDGGRTGSATGHVTSVLDYLKLIDSDLNLTYLMVTHPDSDHYNLLTEVIAYYDVDNFYLPYATVDWGEVDDPDAEKFSGANLIDTAGYRSFMKAAVTEEEAAVYVNMDIFTISGLMQGIEFKFYALSRAEYAGLPKAERNDMSPFGVLTYNGYKIVFAGDAAEAATANYLEDSPTIDCDVFKAAHHGSDKEGCNSSELINDITPDFAIMCAGQGNSYGFPHAGALANLAAVNATVYVTFEVGTIVLTVDKEGKGLFAFNNLATAA